VDLNPGDLVFELAPPESALVNPYSIKNTARIESAVKLFDSLIDPSLEQAAEYRMVFLKCLARVCRYSPGEARENIAKVLKEDSELRVQYKREFKLYIQEGTVKLDTVDRVYVYLPEKARVSIASSVADPICDLFTFVVNVIKLLLLDAGFRVRPFWHEDKKYLILHQHEGNLSMMAERIRLKKDIRIDKLDSLLDEPVDKLKRPYRLKSSILNPESEEEGEGERRRWLRTECREILNPTRNKYEWGLKKVMRMLGSVGSSTEEFINDVELSTQELTAYYEYLVDWRDLVSDLIYDVTMYEPSENEAEYIRRVKDKDDEPHPICVKEFKKDRFKVLFAERMQDLARRHRLDCLRDSMPPDRRISFEYFKLKPNNSVRNKIKNNLIWNTTVAN
jgi:hypothetical protein